MNTMLNQFEMYKNLKLLLLISFFLTINYFAFPVDSTLVGISDSSAIGKKLHSFPKIIDTNQFDFSSSLSNSEIKKFINRDFRIVFASKFPVSSINLGILGQPNLFSFYGQNSENMNVISNGFLNNNLFRNNNDFNLLPLNLIKNLRLEKLPRAFLYGVEMKNVAVLIEYFERNEKVPLTVVNYFQGSNDDAAIDVLFNTKLFSSTILNFNFSNQAISETFDNSDFEQWTLNTQLKQIFADSFTVEVGLDYCKSDLGLFSGIDYDYLKKNVETSQIEDYMYNWFYAPVINPFSNKTDEQFGYYLKYFWQWNSFNSIYLDINTRNESRIFRQNLDNEEYYRPIPKFLMERKYHSTEVIPKYKYEDENLRVELGLMTLIEDNDLFRHYMISGFGIISYNFAEFLKLSAFARKAGISDITFGNKANGFGFDLAGNLKFNTNNNLSYYLGISKFEKYLNDFEEEIFECRDELSDNTNYEFELKYLTEEKNNKTEINLDVFATTTENSPIIYSLATENFAYYPDSLSAEYFKKKQIFGISLNFATKWNYLLYEGNAIFVKTNWEDEKFAENYESQNLNFSTGIYYSDILFNNNLDLKTGLKVNYSGLTNYSIYNFNYDIQIDYFKNSNNFIQKFNDENLKKNFIFDFVTIARIQKTAKVYFTIENLFDTNYYNFPYFPLSGRTMKIGVNWELFN